jgi:hypothetical protein
MGLVRENIEFRRGIDSRKALEVGNTHIKEQNKNWGVMMDNLKEEFDLYAVRDWSNISLYATKLKKKWTKEEIQAVEYWMYYNTYFIVTRAKAEKNPGREYGGRLTWELMLRVRDTRERNYNQRKQDYINKKKIGESIEFKRGKDSRKGLDVGIYRKENEKEFIESELKEIIRPYQKSNFYHIQVQFHPSYWDVNFTNPYPGIMIFPAIEPSRVHQFKRAVKEWIKENTEYKIYSFKKRDKIYEILLK